MENTDSVAVRWLGALSAVVGLWLVIAPFSLGLTAMSAYWNEMIVGVIAVALGIYQYSKPSISWPSWINFVAGLWLIISPYVFNPGQGMAFTNAVISGVVLGLLALFGAIAAGATLEEVHEQRRQMHMH